MEWLLTLISVPKILSNPLVASNRHAQLCEAAPSDCCAKRQSRDEAFAIWVRSPTGEGVMMLHSPHCPPVQPNALPFDWDNNRDIPITPSIVCCECNHLITALTSRCHGMSVRIANVRESPHKTIEVLVVIVMLLIALPSALSAQQQLPEPKAVAF